MSGTAKASIVSYEYDPSRTPYHSHSANLPHLSSWIEDLVRITERSIPIQSAPSTETLVQALQRYDACFKELHSQTKLFSDDLSKLYSKMWIGVLRLMDTMIKVYHRYVKQTSKSQEYAQKLINERQAQLAAHKVQNEEIDLERAALRAKIRNLEGDLAGLGQENRSLVRENCRLREIVETFIESKGQDGIDFDPTKNTHSPLKRAAALYDAGQAQLKVVCTLDADMNDILANVQKEEDRQRFILEEFANLMAANADLLGITADVNARGEKVIKAATRDVGIQSDEIVGHGLVKILEPDEDEALPKLPRRRPPANPEEVPVLNGMHIPLLLRLRMTSFPTVVRIPPLHWTVKSLFACYFGMIRQQDLVGEDPSNICAVGKPKIPLHDFAYEYYVKQFHIPCVAEVNLTQLLRACEHHKRDNKSVLVFCLQMGLSNKDNYPDYDAIDTDFILKIIRILAASGELVGDLNYESPSTVFPMPSIISSSVPMINRPPMNTHFSMSQSILSVGSNQKQSIRLNQKDAALQPGEFRQEIMRSSAVNATKAVFDKWYPDKGEDCAMKVEAMPSASRDVRFVSVHDYLEIAIDQWKGVRLVWSDHIQYLFGTYSNVYHAVAPLTYFNDQGSRGKDTILALASRAAPGEPKKRVVNYFERIMSAAKTNELPLSKRDKSDDGSVNFSRDWVYELMPKKIFGAVLKLLKPDISDSDAAEMYDEACAIQNEMTLFKLQSIWQRFPTNYRNGSDEEKALDLSKFPPHYYVNKITGASQWSIPYYKNSFPAVDIEVSAFEQCILKRDLVEKW